MRIPTPNSVGFPEKYDRWRPGQEEACSRLLEGGTSRFILLMAPTGFGKSLVYTMAAKLLKGRTLILTSTKGLQSQIVSDFGDHVVDIRGRNNYKCRMNTKVTCDQGLCVFGVKCPMMSQGGCPYYDRLEDALRAKIVVTNYSYWMAQLEYSTGLGFFNTIILDEAHAAPEHILNHLGVKVSRKWDGRFIEMDENNLPSDHTRWRQWARNGIMALGALMNRAWEKGNEKEFVNLKRTEGKMSRVSKMDNSWVWEESPDGIHFSPVWPARYAEKILFNKAPKVVLTSATVVERTTALLGISRGNYESLTFPHPFRVRNRPVIHIPTVRLNHRTSPAEHREWIRKVDSIIRTRNNTKGIIHTVSYARKDMLIRYSRYSGRMISHSNRNVETMVAEFKRSSKPLILVSPSMATGWDFPGDECRWQIIIKVPYPDSRGAVARAQHKVDPEFSSYVAAQQLVQAVGRGVRSEDDWCETFILDNNMEWFIRKNRKMLVDWFVEAYRVSNIIPKPLSGR